MKVLIVASDDETIGGVAYIVVLDGVYRNSTGVFHEVAAPTSEEL